MNTEQSITIEQRVIDSLKDFKLSADKAQPEGPGYLDSEAMLNLSC